MKHVIYKNKYGTYALAGKEQWDQWSEEGLTLKDTFIEYWEPPVEPRQVLCHDRVSDVFYISSTKYKTLEKARVFHKNVMGFVNPETGEVEKK